MCVDGVKRHFRVVVVKFKKKKMWVGGVKRRFRVVFVFLFCFVFRNGKKYLHTYIYDLQYSN